VSEESASIDLFARRNCRWTRACFSLRSRAACISTRRPRGCRMLSLTCGNLVRGNGFGYEGPTLSASQVLTASSPTPGLGRMSRATPDLAGVPHIGQIHPDNSGCWAVKVSIPPLALATVCSTICGGTCPTRDLTIRRHRQCDWGLSNGIRLESWCRRRESNPHGLATGGF
jgi:hypothetical protein